MKVLIWIGCLFGITIINSLIGMVVGFNAGYFVLYLLIGFVARKLCEKWDDHVAAKNAASRASDEFPNAVSAFVDGKVTSEQPMFCNECGEKLLPESQFCRKCGKKLGDD